MSDFLVHHGILGQKWGVRRFQNEDGSLTPEGKVRYTAANRIRRAAKTRPIVEDIISTMSTEDKRRMNIGEDGYLNIEQGEYLVKRIIEKDGNIPVSFIDLLVDGKGLDVVIGTRSGEEYRGKGYATKVAKKGLDWYNKNKDKYGYESFNWWVLKQNTPSRKLAEKIGLELDKSTVKRNEQWIAYRSR